MSENNITKLLRVLAAPSQDLENVFMQLLLLRTIDTATGAQLDAIGLIVGQDRNGVSDDETYRRYVRARITTNRSKGVIENFLSVADLVVNDDDAYFHIFPDGIAALRLRVEDIVTTDEIADILIGFLRDTAAAGVRIILESGSTPIAGWFRWNTTALGFGTITDATHGGKLISARE